MIFLLLRNSPFWHYLYKRYRQNEMISALRCLYVNKDSRISLKFSVKMKGYLRTCNVSPRNRNLDFFLFWVVKQRFVACKTFYNIWVFGWDQTDTRSKQRWHFGNGFSESGVLHEIQFDIFMFLFSFLSTVLLRANIRFGILRHFSKLILGQK